MPAPNAPENIDEYISTFSPEIREILQKIRAIIRDEAPVAEERMSYRMPAFKLHGGMLIYFAAFQQHMGIFPPLQGDASLRKKLAPYLGEKGNLKFPYTRPMPYALIKQVVKCRLREHLEYRAKVQAKKR